MGASGGRAGGAWVRVAAIFGVVAGVVLCACGDDASAPNDAGIADVAMPEADAGEGDADPPADASTAAGARDAPPAGPVCGNHVVEPGESCDDGDTIVGDGCDAVCRYEAACGDGTPDPEEVCDDGNRLSGDGCRGDCAGEEACGDGTLDVA